MYFAAPILSAIASACNTMLVDSDMLDRRFTVFYLFLHNQVLPC